MSRRTLEGKRPRKLNFNAPLLSTRRSCTTTAAPAEALSCTNSQGGWWRRDSTNRIPFCWEQSPGKPKNNVAAPPLSDDAYTPRPKLPPNRWRRPSLEKTANNGYEDGCDADVEENEEGNDDVFSDAIDVLSLTEAIDIVEKAEMFHGSDSGLNSKSAATDLDDDERFNLNLESCGGWDDDTTPSPNFIIERFLPDATALAVASTSAMNVSINNLNKKLPYYCKYPVREVAAAAKGCGLEALLPWRMKHRVCGVKSPFRQSSSIVEPVPKSVAVKQRKSFPAIDHRNSVEWRCN